MLPKQLLYGYYEHLHNCTCQNSLSQFLWLFSFGGEEMSANERGKREMERGGMCLENHLKGGHTVSKASLTISQPFFKECMETLT